MEMVSSGAESVIYLNSKKNIVKDRIRKNYRIAEIDNQLRDFRTKREVKVMQQLHKLGLAVPKVVHQANNIIEMENIEGMQLKMLLDNNPMLSVKIGENLTLMHDNDMIHGDLTTSNMILKAMDDRSALYFIDFGLSFYSKRIEDKAVDIHLFKQALESKHFRINDMAYRNFLSGYRPKDRKQILDRLDEVEKRGRYKEKA